MLYVLGVSRQFEVVIELDIILWQHALLVCVQIGSIAHESVTVDFVPIKY